MHINFNMIFTSLHHPYVPFTVRPDLPPSLHYTFLHIPTMCNTHFVQFNTLITFPTLFLKAFGLQRSVLKSSAGYRFHSRMVLFTKEYFSLSVLCFLSLIFRSRSTLPLLSLRSTQHTCHYTTCCHIT